MPPPTRRIGFPGFVAPSVAVVLNGRRPFDPWPLIERRSRRTPWFFKTGVAMRFLLIAMTATALLLGVLAAHLIFGDKDPDPVALARAAHLAKIAELKPKAEAGNTAAQVELGRVLRGGYEGDEGKRDYTQAMAWFNKAAEKGSASAQVAIGRMHEKGEGVRVDPFKAAEWYGLAARAARDPEAQFALGELYFTGRGVAHDYGEAVTWYERAARQGHPVAQYLMGVMCREGWGVRQDSVQALVWFTLASARAKEVAEYNAVYDAGAERAKLLKGLNQSQIAEAERRVGAWRPVR